MLVNCTQCGILFQKRLRDICDKCLESERLLIQSIEHYVEQNKNVFVPITHISEGTGIDISKITELYKKGRLSEIASRLSVKCSICNIEIRGLTKKGLFCVKCYDQFSREKTKTAVKASKEGVVLRTFDKDIIHTRKNINPEEKSKFGFKKSTD